MIRVSSPGAPGSAFRAGARAALDARGRRPRPTAERLNLRLAIDYGAQQAITEAARELVRRAGRGEIAVSDVDADLVGALVGGGSSHADLIVRTAGDQRLSDFLLWEAAYAELAFVDVAWPEFRASDLERVVDDFRGRERRFGGLAPVAAAGASA